MTTVSEKQTISPAELAELVKQGKAANLIDVRTAPEFSGVHAVGAQHFPLAELDCKALAAQAKAGEPFYILCKSGGRARIAQGKLKESGIECAVVVEGGTDAWVAAGLPTVKGVSKVWPLQRQAMLGAGIVNLIGVVLAFVVDPYFLAINAFVGFGLMAAGALDFCLMGIVLSYMPWNRGKVAATCSVK